MIASLMMYRRAELDGALERFWALIRAELAARGIESPEALSQEAGEFEVWENPEMVLSQTCGMPYRLWLHDKVGLVGTPDYGVEGAPAGYYRSALVVRRREERGLADMRGARFAYNQNFSQSGWAAAYAHLARFGFWFENVVQTGAHLASARAVAEGRADIASLDAVTWRLIERYEPCAAELRVLDWTEPTPGLLLITALKGREGEIYEAVSAAIAALEGEDSAALGLRGIARIPKAAYLAVANPPPHA